MDILFGLSLYYLIDEEHNQVSSKAMFGGQNKNKISNDNLFDTK